MSDRENEEDHNCEEDYYEDFQKHPEDEQKYQQQRMLALQELERKDQEEKKALQEKKRIVKMQRLEKKIKKYEGYINNEKELSAVAEKYASDRKARAEYYYYKQQLLTRKLNIVQGKEALFLQSPMNTEQRVNLVNFNEHLKSAFSQKDNKCVVKHLVSKRYIV